MYNDYINIKFSYNGDLGVLQQKTIDNKIFCGRLLQNNIISREEWRKAMQEIYDYFLHEIEKVVADPYYYTDMIGK